MRRQGRFRPIGGLIGTCTVVAIVLTAIVAAPGGATIPEKEYKASFEMECVLAPGVLNIHPTEKFKVTTAAMGPEQVATGEEVVFHGAHSTIESPLELAEEYVSLEANEVTGKATNLVLDDSGFEPASINIFKPAEFPSGPPFFAPLEKGHPFITPIPSFALGETGRTYSFGPQKVTQTSGTTVVTVSGAPGFTEPEPGSYAATGNGIVTEVEGRKSGAHVIGPLKTVCNAPAGVVAASIPIGPGTGTSCPPTSAFTTPPTSAFTTPPTRTTTNTPTGTTTNTFTGTFTSPPTGTFTSPATGATTSTTSCTTTRTTTLTCPSVTSVSSSVTVEPAQGPASGGTTVILSGPGVEHVESVSLGPKLVSFERLPNGDLRVVTPPGRGKVRVRTSGVVIVAPPGCFQEGHEGRGTFTYEPVGGTAGEKMVDLGTLGGEESEAEAVDDAGQVVGNAATESGYRHAFFWTQSGGMVDLGTLGRTESEALAVNDSGQVAGVAINCPHEGGGCSSARAFFWTQAGGMVDLGTLGGQESRAVALNGHGQVVGYAQTSSGAMHAFSWTQAGGIVDLGTFGGQDSQAYAVNEAGEVVGEAETSNNDPHAFSWTQAGGVVDLGTFGGVESTAIAVNRSGQIAGHFMPSNANNNRHAFFWTQAGGAVDLGTLDGNQSYADAVNDSGRVVGTNQTCPELPEFGSCGSIHAFSWTQAGGMVGLGALGGSYSDAVAVNDSGQVAGQAGTSSGVGHAFSWTQAGGMVDLGTFGGEYSFANAVNDSGQVVGRADTSLGTGQAVLWNTAQVEKAEYKNWKLSGSINDKKLGQAITLPEGSTFNGSGEVSTETGAGSVKGNLSIPPFTSSLKLFGPVAVNLGLTLSATGPLEGTVAKSDSVPSDETLSAPLKLNLGVTSLAILGLTIPTTCATTEPLALGLSDTLTQEELLTKGWSFAGTTSIPKVKCQGGFLSGLFGVILTGLLAGPEDPYSLTVSAP
jgi:probable HAF family extracellular repeat protein